MYITNQIQYKTDSKEEFLPGVSTDFPYMASKSILDKFADGCVPWHWHNAVELFYMESGSLEYYTPGGITTFPEGSGGIINSNVLHMTKMLPDSKTTSQILHIFDPVFISGGTGNLIDQKYVMPLTAASQIELIALSPDDSAQARILNLLRESFTLDENKTGYELLLRQKLSEIWLLLFELAQDCMNAKSVSTKPSDQIKKMMVYVQEHYGEKISISQLADVAFLSERACYRIFQTYLHTTPVDYIKSYRLQMACQLLINTSLSLTEISNTCGFGTSSYFGKIFKESIGCTPKEYRLHWKNHK